jgi:hypothetical protein
MTVEELSQRITHAEVIEWMAYKMHERELQDGTAPPVIIEIDDVETRSRLIEQSLFGSCL